MLIAGCLGIRIEVGCDEGRPTTEQQQEATLASIVLARATGEPARAWRFEGPGGAGLEVRWAGGAWSLPFSAIPPARDLAALSELDAGHLLVVYTDGNGDQMLTVLDAAGGSSTPPVTSGQLDGARFEPSVAKTEAGAYLAWREVPHAGGPWPADLEDTYVQRMTWDGTTLSFGEAWTLPHPEIFMLGDQRRPALASSPMTPSGALWAAWEDFAQGQQGPEHGDVRVSLMPTPIVRTEPAM